jgi:predicted nucleotidyltransferase
MKFLTKNMKMEAINIIKELNVEGEVLNIYPYGSRVYGTANNDSDSDFIIVMKSAFLDSGSFKDNAISNEDGSIQGVLYSRGGFIDAINNYEIGALECLFLNDSDVLQKKWPFKLQKLVIKDMIKKIIQKASNSWHIAKFQFKDDEIERAKKGVFSCYQNIRFRFTNKKSW